MERWGPLLSLEASSERERERERLMKNCSKTHSKVETECAQKKTEENKMRKAEGKKKY